MVDMLVKSKEKKTEGDIVVCEKFKGQVRESLNIFVSKKIADKITPDQVQSIMENADDMDDVIHNINLITGYTQSRSNVNEKGNEIKLIIQLIR